MSELTVCVVGAIGGERHGTPTNADTLIMGLKQVGIQSVAASRYPAGVRRGLDVIATMVRNRSRYQVVVAAVFSFRAFFWAELAGELARRLRKPLILWLHGGRLPEFYGGWWGRERIDRLFTMANAIVAPSSYLASRFQEVGYPVGIMPYGLPVRSTYPYRQRESCRPRLLWLRAIHPLYNPLLAVRTLALVRHQAPDAHLVMCGPIPDQDLMRNMTSEAERLGVADALEIAGPISKDRIRREGLEHDILLNTPTIDNAPVSVMEALAMGMCVVSTRVGGIPYLLSHEQDALLVPPNDPEAMAASVQRILREPDLARRLSTNGRRTAEQFDFGEVLPRWQHLLERVAHGWSPASVSGHA